MEITLKTPQKIVIKPEETKTLEKLTVMRMVDLPNEKKVRVFIKELREPITLWEGDEYDAIGQWTDSDVQAKLTELYS
jgi:hypothetical protein